MSRDCKSCWSWLFLAPDNSGRNCRPYTAIVLVVLLLSAIALHTEQPPYLQRSSGRYRFDDEFDSEIEEYFAEIEIIRTEDVENAARNYQRFIQKFGGRITRSGKMRIPVRTRVIAILKADPELLKAYRDLNEPPARQRLAAVQTIEERHRLIDDFPLTQPAGEALYYLAAYSFDHGRIAQTVRLLDQLHDYSDFQKQTASLSRAIVSLQAKPKTTAPRLEKLNTLHPDWIGGVNTSSVYPDEINPTPRVAVSYPLIVLPQRIIVSSGQDTYAYDSISGRHTWQPGPGHAIRVSSLLTDGFQEHEFDEFVGAASNAGRFVQTEILHAPAGNLVRSKGRIAAVFNKGETPSALMVFNVIDGAVLDTIDGEKAADLFREKGIPVIEGIGYIGYHPAAHANALFFSLHMVGNRQEQCLLGSWDFTTGKLLWAREAFRAQLIYRHRGWPEESWVNIDGGYVQFFSYSGYMGCYESETGIPIWEQTIADADQRRRQMTQTAYTFEPVQSADGFLIEGPQKNKVSLVRNRDGLIDWQISAPNPAWALSSEYILVISTRDEEKNQLIAVDSRDGAIKWQSEGVYPYKGSIAGKSLYCADSKGMAEVELMSGTIRHSYDLKNCALPGRVYLSGNRILIVNSEGVFCYAGD